MYCANCGLQLPDSAKFCVSCGIAVHVIKEPVLGTVPQVAPTVTKLVLAQCTNCGAQLEVDSSQKAAICPHCNSAYIVEQAINTYNVNVQGNFNVDNATINVLCVDLENLCQRAKAFEAKSDLENALAYYNKILDMDINYAEALDGVLRIEKTLQDYIYYSASANTTFTSGVLRLKKGMLIYKNKNKKETVYHINSIRALRKSMGCLCFMYDGINSEIAFGCSKTDEFIHKLTQAQNGIYDNVKGKKSCAIEEYIKANFTPKTIMAAIKYYKEQTGVTLKEAMDKVEQLFID